jgi:hypothetical protein
MLLPMRPPDRHECASAAQPEAVNAWHQALFRKYAGTPAGDNALSRPSNRGQLVWKPASRFEEATTHAGCFGYNHRVPCDRRMDDMYRCGGGRWSVSAAPGRSGARTTRLDR